MKKIHLFLASAAMLAVGCTNEEYLGNAEGVQNTNGAIVFAPKNAPMTRADLTHTESAAALDNNFVVVGFKGSATAAANTGLVFDHYNVNYVANTANTTTSNTADWEYVNQDMKVKGTDPAAALATSAKEQTIKYWDHAAASYDFIAFSMGKGSASKYAVPTAVDKANLATAAYTLAGDASTLGECYISNITTVEEPNYTNAAVMMKFRHLTSKVRLAFFETVPGYVIKDIKFRETLTDAHDPADAANTNGVLIGTDAFNEKGTFTVYFPTTGTANKTNTDYNQAHVKFAGVDADNDGNVDADATSSKKTFGAVDYHNVAENQIAAGTTYLAQSASACSYVKNAAGTAGGYDVVLPHENDSKVLSIQIDYTLVSTDGNAEEIKVYGARADIPAAYTAWKSGYAYTYKFKISQNTNGHTGTDVDDKGLTAITFDAVVINDEENGIQETITTVTTPSITTYGYNGASTIDENEYKTGDEIYATVQDGDAAKAATNLYTVTLTDTDNSHAAAAQDINEASVANCIAKGGSVKDANGWTMAVTGVSGSVVASVPTSSNTSLTVPALKWWAGASGTIYVVEYIDSSSNKYYKIVRIQ